MANLFSPLKIKSIEFKNRIVVSPMCEYSSEDGFANNWHLVHLGSRAIGGAAFQGAQCALLVHRIVELIEITGRIFPG
jgi:2,4-dienoyl-CoA reductase-like NADH-dependent reductase (Old Yellow Enzyme family)